MLASSCRLDLKGGFGQVCQPELPYPALQGKKAMPDETMSANLDWFASALFRAISFEKARRKLNEYPYGYVLFLCPVP